MGGESGPKARSNGVVDGKQVNIPVLIYMDLEGRRRLNSVCVWNAVEASKVLRGRTKTHLELRRDPVRWNLFRLDANDVMLPRKARKSLTYRLPVPETDTGRLVEHTKGRERTLSKELGKIAP